MEPESSSSYTQVPATCPYPEPTPSSPHDLLQLPEVINTVCINTGNCVGLNNVFDNLLMLQHERRISWEWVPKW